MNYRVSSLMPVSDKDIWKLPLPDLNGRLGWDDLYFFLIDCVSNLCKIGNKDQANQIMRYVVDNVNIYSKEQILDVLGYMKILELNDDKRSYFLNNYRDLLKEEISLDRKELVKNYPIDAEVPKGLGNFIFGLQFLDDNLLFGNSVHFYTVINRNVRVVPEINRLSGIDINDVYFENPPQRLESVGKTKDRQVLGTNLEFWKTTGLLGLFPVVHNREKISILIKRTPLLIIS